MKRRFAIAVGAIAAIGLAGSFTFATRFNGDGPALPRHVTMTYTGLNYYDPPVYFTQCREWEWLQSWCYDGTAAREPSQAQLESDLGFVNTQHLGEFLRVWVSLDELMKWNPATGFAGFAPHALGDLDDALAIFNAHGIAVDLVMYVYSKGSTWTNQFQPAALDGEHPAWRTNYIRAERLFIRHLSRNSFDAATVKVIDLQTEPYYQLEQYFRTPTTLGKFHACATPWGTTDTRCVDDQIVHPWLEDVYHAARSVTHQFEYTFADTGRLLTPNRSRQRHWISLYPVDVYDIHMYNDYPWRHLARWTSAVHLPHPWFAGEAGCGSGNISCTYNGTRSTKIDTWWLRNLGRYGARSVLLESHVTLWKYPYGNRSQVLTATGKAVSCLTDFNQHDCHA